MRGIRRVLGTIRQLRPKADVVLASVLPRGRDDTMAGTVARVNDRLDNLAAEFDAVFADARQVLSASTATSDDFREQSIHLTESGYAKWAPVVESGLRAASRAAA